MTASGLLSWNGHRSRLIWGSRVVQQLKALAGPLTDAGEHGDTLDQFYHQDGLSDTGTAEHSRLAALSAAARPWEGDTGIARETGAGSDRFGYGIRSPRQRPHQVRPADDADEFPVA